MRNWVRAHAGTAVILLGVLSGLVTIVGWALPTARNWLVDHPGIGWTVAICACFLLAGVLIRNDSLHGAIDGSDQRTGVLRIERDNAQRDMQSAQAAQAITERSYDEVKARLTRTESERDSARNERDEAVAALHPTKRDIRQFAELLEIWDQRGNLMTWLNIGFNAKQWTDKESDPLYMFVDEWQFRYFDDAAFNETYTDFFAHVRSLVTWMSARAGWDPVLNKGRADTDPVIYSIADGNEREGGWPAFDAIRDEALRYVRGIFELREELEMRGRSCGL